MSSPKPLLSRRLKVSFEVEVKALPLPADLLAEHPELAALQKAILSNPAMCDKMLAYWALDEVENHLGDLPSEDGWMPGDPYDALLDAVRATPLAQLRRFLYEGLVHTGSFDYVEEIFDAGRTSRLASKASVTDLITGQTLEWDFHPASLFRRRDAEQRYLLAEVQGELVLCLNLVEYEPGDLLEEVAAEVQGQAIDCILACVLESEYSPADRDDLAVEIVEVFGELPVEVVAGPEKEE